MAATAATGVDPVSATLTLSVVVVAPDGIRATFSRTTTITAPRKRK